MSPRRGRRWAVGAVLLVLMAGFGMGVNRYLAGSTRVDQINDAAVRPPGELDSDVDLPGTLYVVQRGQLFRLSQRHFTPLPRPPSGQWLQPASAGDGHRLLAVLRSDQHSDLWLLDAGGQRLRQLTHHAAATIDDNHWVFWPQLSGDGSRLFVSHDAPKSGYNVDLSIWSGSLPDRVISRRWTTPSELAGSQYTGGDVHPAPLPSGGVIFARYQISAGRIFSTLQLLRVPGGEPIQLSNPSDNCDQPALSPDGTSLAMICSVGKQTTRLVVGHLSGRSLDNLRTVVASCLCSAPAWAPDGSGLAYLAPADATGHFQLWWLLDAAGAGTRAQQATTSLDLDATSPPAWLTAPLQAPAPPSPTP